MLRFLLSIFVLTALVGLAHADTIILKNGSKLEGRIVKETPDSVVILVSGVGKLEVERKRIAEIERDAKGTEPPPKTPRPAKPG